MGAGWSHRSFRLAIEQQDLDSLRSQAKSHKQIVNVVSRTGKSPLIRATTFKFLSVVELLIELGADLNYQDKVGETALFKAVKLAHLPLVKLLLEKGANPNKGDKNHSVAHAWFIFCDVQPRSSSSQLRLDILKALLEKGLDANKQMNDDGETLLQRLSYENVEEDKAIEMLLQSGAKVNIVDGIRYMPQHHAARKGHVKIIGLLLQHGADLSATTSVGQTARDIAELEQQYQVVQFLDIQKAKLAAGMSPSRASITVQDVQQEFNPFGTETTATVHTSPVSNTSNTQTKPSVTEAQPFVPNFGDAFAQPSNPQPPAPQSPVSAAREQSSITTHPSSPTSAPQPTASTEQPVFDPFNTASSPAQSPATFTRPAVTPEPTTTHMPPRPKTATFSSIPSPTFARSPAGERFGSAFSQQSERGSCEFQQLCTRMLAQLQLDPQFFSTPPDIRCFCENCHPPSRGTVAERGVPPMKYSLPVGWCGCRLVVHDERLRGASDWHIAYCGVPVEQLTEVLQSGFLVKGQDTPSGIHQAEEHRSLFQGQIRQLADGSYEPFDTNSLFISPSVTYAAHRIYAVPFSMEDGLTGRRYRLQAVLQLRARPGSYSIGQQTIGATQQIHPAFSNDEIEWCTKDTYAQVFTGLLLRVVPAE